MAGDLIPPPSPAGKPAPEGGKPGPEGKRPEDGERPEERREFGAPAPTGDDLVLAVRPDDAGAARADREAEETPDEAAAQRESPFRSRFGLITGALIGMALAATLILVVVIASPRDDSATRWSSWEPSSDNAVTAAGEIADHVARRYRLNDGSQLVLVEAGPIVVNDIPLNVVVRTAPVGGDIVPVEGNGVWYVLNGLGTHGSIEREEPSSKRLALLKREALELALYTFRYTNADHVVALLPPPPPESSGASSTSSSGNGSSAAGSATATPTPSAAATTTATAAPSSSESATQPIAALLFRPGDLRAQLRLPLDVTIPASTPRPRTLSDQDEQAVTDFTAGNIFNASVRTAQNGAAYLVLDPARPAAVPVATPSPTPTPAAKAQKKKPKKK